MSASTVLPDILGEAVLIAAWGESRQGQDAVRRAAGRCEAVTRAIIRTCQDFLVRGQQAPLGWLQVLRAGASDIDALLRLAGTMPKDTTELREAALEVTQAALDAMMASPEPAGGDEAALARRAFVLNNLSVRLSDLGRREPALAAIEEAVAIRRGLAATRPDAFAPDLAGSLNNLSNCLSDLGRREPALAASEEAVATYRGLAAARPDAFAPDLASSLNNLSVFLSALGRREPALAAIEEAVAIRRGLAAARPDVFAPDLAGSLNTSRRPVRPRPPRAGAGSHRGGRRNLSRPGSRSARRFRTRPRHVAEQPLGCLSALGRREPALAAIEEAVALSRLGSRSARRFRT